eukprot:3043844-Rhodomonas_salina.1
MAAHMAIAVGMSDDDNKTVRCRPGNLQVLNHMLYVLPKAILNFGSGAIAAAKNGIGDIVLICDGAGAFLQSLDQEKGHNHT